MSTFRAARPGLPASPDAVLRESIGKERRPLSGWWGSGDLQDAPDAIEKKERKRGEQINVTNLARRMRIDHETDSKFPNELHRWHGGRPPSADAGGRRAVRHFGANFTVQSTVHRRAGRAKLSRDLLDGDDGLLAKLPLPFVMLFDLSATDERMRSHRHGLRQNDTVFYHLISSTVTPT